MYAKKFNVSYRHFFSEKKRYNNDLRKEEKKNHAVTSDLLKSSLLTRVLKQKRKKYEVSI